MNVSRLKHNSHQGNMLVHFMGQGQQIDVNICFNVSI